MREGRGLIMDINQDVQVVVFRLASEEYALPITKVKDINRIAPVTKMPQAPSFMEGIINLRDKIIPIVDLRERFGLPAGEMTGESRFVVVEFNGQMLGIMVDSVAEVLTIPAGGIDLPPAAAKLDLSYIEGIGKVEQRLLILLNVDKIFTDNEIKMLETLKDAI